MRVSNGAAAPPPGPVAGERIGRYRIDRVLASGGMGTVYVATQDDPQREVALKVMRAGIASRSALRRFHFEAQILGRLRHPNIAQVYEAGTQDDGGGAGPYFAMEYIADAQPITAYADAAAMGTRDRLAMLAKVCEAVHHGHQKGVIHRDLKPSNVLVDVFGEPKVIDFGVARATDSDVTIATQATDLGQLVGTLAYMSPEQCAADPDDLDTRSDVYSLGVMLYELLCGHLPYDVSRVPFPEAARMIRENLPPKPSTVNRTLRGDVETIALKALEKTRERRYQSAADLGQDIHRYLRGEAIEARPPSAAYRVRTFARRHKVAFAVLVMLLVAVPVLTAATVVAVTSAVRARDAQLEAEASRLRAEAVTDMVTDAMVSSNPYQGGTDTFLVTAAMDQVIAELDAGALRDQPETEAALRQTISEVLFGNWRAAEAVQQAERALEINRELHGGDHPEVADSLNVVAKRLDGAGRLTEALDRFQGALEMRRRLFPDDHLSVAGALNQVAYGLDNVGRTAEALAMFESALQMKQRLIAGDHKTIAVARSNVANCLSKMGREEEALALYHDALEMYRRLFDDADNNLVATTLVAIGRCLHSLGEPAEALTRHEEALEIRRRLFGADFYDLGWPLNNLAWCLESLGRASEALPKHEQALETRRRHSTDDSYGIATGLQHLARCLHALDRTEEALRSYQEALEMRRRLLQVDNRDVAGDLSGVASCLESLGRSEEALPRYEEAIHVYRRLLPPGHSEALRPQIGMARTLVSLGRYADAEPLLLDAAEHCARSDASRWWHERTVIEESARLYAAWHAAAPDEGHDTKAAEWRAKLESRQSED
ncbi:MAG: tetratricopeptide repeat protein [Planctomycetota bacterium]